MKSDLKQIICFIFVILLTLTGCRSNVNTDPVSLFKNKHSHEANQYVYIYPTRLDIFQSFNDAKTGEIAEIASSLKEKFKDSPEVVDFAGRIMQLEENGDKGWEKIVGELNEASSDGGVICQFKWSDGKTQTIGFLVLKSGDIVKRMEWVSQKID